MKMVIKIMNIIYVMFSTLRFEIAVVLRRNKDIYFDNDIQSISTS